MSRSPDRRRTRLALAAAACAGVALSGFLLSRLGLDAADKVASVVSAIIAAAALSLELLRRRRTGPGAPAGPAEAEFVDALARRLGETWETEWVRRRMHDPGPLPVSWTNADELADHWQNIADTEDEREPVPLDGTFGDLADVLGRVPSGRLVLVGPGGQGKSVLCLNLARDLLRRRPGGRIPVLLELSTWNPVTTPLRDWIVDRLPIDVAPALAGVSPDGRRWADRLLAGRRFVLLLDGLDELSDELHATAITRINDAGREPLVITCREDQYVRALERAHDVVSAAAVVRTTPLSWDTVTTWLARTSAGPHTTGKWDALLHAAPDPGRSAVARVLGSALMAATARAVYGETAARPDELLGADDTAAVERHLLSRLLPTALRDLPVTGRNGRSRTSVEAFMVWLSRKLTSRHTERIEWWRLPALGPRRTVRLLKAAAIGAVAVLLTGGNAMSGGDAAGGGVLTFTFVVFALSTLVADRDLRRHPPGAVRLSLRPDVARGGSVLLSAVRRGALLGALVGIPGIVLTLLAWVLVDGQAISAPARMIAMAVVAIVGTALLCGVGVGLAVGVPLAVAETFTAPVDLDEVNDPRSLLRSDRRISVARSALVGSVLGVTLLPALLYLAYATNVALSDFLGTGFQQDAPAPSLPGVRAILVIGVPAGAAFLVTSTAWGQFAFTRAVLAIGGRIPWRFVSTLDLARDRGILRQNGVAYLFRHERLQAHLAEPAEPPPAVRRTGRTAGTRGTGRRPVRSPATFRSRLVRVSRRVRRGDRRRAAAPR